MKFRSFLVIGLLMLSLALTACGRDDPKTALEAAVQKLQKNLEAKDTSAVMKQIDPSFQAQAEFDGEWARKTMTLMFLRYANVNVIAVSQTSSVNPASSKPGVTEAKVLVTGAQGLIPERAEPFDVCLDWRLVSGEWKLAAIRWD